MKKILTTFACCFLMSAQALAHEVEKRFDLATMAQNAKAVFHGKVISIDYRGSKGTKNQVPLLHTFVTYEVEDVLFGNPGIDERGTFTLRFLGGAAESGEMMIIHTHPRMNIGDEDILFVSDNGATECPLVSCANGRFRVVEDKVYNELGQMIMLHNESIVLGEMVEHENFDLYTVGNITIKLNRHRSENFEADSDQIDKFQGKNNNGTHMDVSSFKMAILDDIAQKRPEDLHGSNKYAQNVDKDKLFYFIPTHRGKPIAVPDYQITTSARNDQEREELETFHRNGGNPVLH